MPERPLHRRVLAGAALLLGAMALAAGEPRPGSRTGMDAGASAATAAAGAGDGGSITALELARMIRDDVPGLRVLDARDREAFDADHIPGAAHLEPASATFDSTDGSLVVVYAEDVAAAARARDALRVKGARHVVMLAGGFEEWTRTIVNPVIPPLTPWASRADSLARAEWLATSRWFGGVPATPSVRAIDDPTRAVRRRGC